MKKSELQQLLDQMGDEEIIIGIDNLLSVLMEKLKTLSKGKDIGFRDPEGEPVLSLRRLAELIDGLSTSYMSQMINGRLDPCYKKLDKIASTLGIKYVVTNLDSANMKNP